jgi:hypothetical protein
MFVGVDGSQIWEQVEGEVVNLAPVYVSLKKIRHEGHNKLIVGCNSLNEGHNYLDESQNP